MSQLETMGIELGIMPANDHERYPGSQTTTPALSRVGSERELRHASTSRILAENGEDSGVNVSELPPVDKGGKAWTFCACAFVVEMFIFGWFNSYGVFQDFYSSHAPFQNESAAAISVIGTAGVAINYMEGIIVIAAASRYPEYAKLIMWISLFGMVLSLVLSSFATKIWHLIILQGVTYGLAAGACYTPIINFLSQWFVAKRGLASGLIFCGGGAGGFFVPLVIGALLERVRFRWTLRIWAAILGVLCGVAILGVNPRIPARKPTVDRPRSSWIPKDVAFLTNLRLLLFVAATGLQALSYYPVSIFIPTYTSSLSSSALSSTVSLALFNLTSLLGNIAVGRLSDLYPYPVLVAVIGGATALTTFLLWGFASSLGRVFAFVVLFGGLNGGFSAFWPRVATSIAGERAEHASFTVGIFSTVKGVAAIVGPLIAASLHSSVSALSSSSSSSPGSSTGAGPSTYGSFGFRNVQFFVGSMAVATGLCGIALLVASSKRWRSDR